MNQVLLSIIIPAYNVENYLQKCVLSCIRQNFPIDNYEIIIINDGSTDNTLLIAKKFEEQYRNIKVYSQTNAGLSVTRNNGLSLSKGRYVWFVDSDDWIEADCLIEIGKLLTKDYDLIQIFCRCINELDMSEYCDDRYNFSLLKGVFSGLEVLEKGGLPVMAQLSIYNRQFLIDNNLRFMPGILHEDTEFKPRVEHYAKTITVLDKICYNYLQRKSGSITSQFSIRNAMGLIASMESLHSFSKTFDLREYRMFGTIISVNMNSLLFHFRELSQQDKYKIKKDLKSKSHLFHRMYKSNKLIYKIEGLIFCLNVNIGICSYLFIDIARKL